MQVKSKFKNGPAHKQRTEFTVSQDITHVMLPARERERGRCMCVCAVCGEGLNGSLCV